MEETPLFPLTPEDDDSDDEDDGKLHKKRLSLDELLLPPKEPEEKPKFSVNIGRSLFEAPAKKEAAAEPESTEVLSGEEEIYVNQKLAEGHLEHPVTEDAPMPPVTDFLGRVAEKGNPAGAYSATLSENNLEQTIEANNEAAEEGPDNRIGNVDVTDADHQELPPEIAVSEAGRGGNLPPRPSQSYGQSELQPPIQPRSATQSESTSFSATPAANERSKSGSEARPPSLLATELAGYLIGRRTGVKRSKEIVKTQKKLVTKVRKMEATLTKQELTLQKLSREHLVLQRSVAPPERTRPGLRESRLNLVKPERAEHLGKMVIRSVPPERSKAASAKRPRAEQVKSMPREELLSLSRKITAEGASLKDMYDNHLFGEGALRRIIAEHLRGHDIMPLLRREILEHQIDYERDPLLRDKTRFEGETGDRLFDKLLLSTELLKQTVTNQSKETKRQLKSEAGKKAGTANDQDRHSGIAFNVAMAVIIIILFAILAFVLFKRL